VEPVPSLPVTSTSRAMQAPSPAVAVELRSASPMNDREEMSDAADAFQCVFHERHGLMEGHGRRAAGGRPTS
jgi:hypothetical protein